MCKCGHVHEDTLPWYIILLRGTLKCGHNWCVNPFHVVLESAFESNRRKERFESFATTSHKKHDSRQCPHDPPCINTPDLDEADANGLAEDVNKSLHATREGIGNAARCLMRDCNETVPAGVALSSMSAIHN
jgi:hypothetical protein